MCYFCSGRNRSIFETLFQIICSTGDEFVFYEDGLNLLKDVVFGSLTVDFILLDYDLYKSFSELIFDLLRAKKIIIPLILISNCHVINQKRINSWISENEFFYDFQNMHLYFEILKKIDTALESEKIKLLFSESILVEEPVLPLKSKKNKFSDFILHKLSFPPVVYSLFKFFYKNKSREVSIEEIAVYLNVNLNSEKERHNTVYSYLSRLRKCMEKIPDSELALLRTRKGYYRLIIR